MKMIPILLVVTNFRIEWYEPIIPVRKAGEKLAHLPFAWHSSIRCNSTRPCDSSDHARPCDGDTEFDHHAFGSRFLTAAAGRSSFATHELLDQSHWKRRLPLPIHLSVWIFSVCSVSSVELTNKAVHPTVELIQTPKVALGEQISHAPRTCNLRYLRARWRCIATIRCDRNNRQVRINPFGRPSAPFLRPTRYPRTQCARSWPVLRGEGMIAVMTIPGKCMTFDRYSRGTAGRRIRGWEWHKTQG